MQIVAWKSEDGKIFEDKKLYTNHVRKLNREKKAAEKARLLQIKSKEWYEDNLWHAVKSIDQLCHAVKLHSAVLGADSIDKYRWFDSSQRSRSPIPIISDFSFGSIGYKDSVSASHSSPVGKPTNFMSDPLLPTGYPGFSGSVRYTVDWDVTWSGFYPGGSDFWNATRMHTGTGGAGNSNRTDDGVYQQEFYYEFRLYIDDWPGLKESVEEARAHINELIIMDKLSGTVTKKPSIMELINKRYPASSYQPIKRNA